MNELLALHHLSSEEVLQILFSTKHRAVFISLIQTLKQSEIEQHRLLPEFQNKIVSLQSNYLINSDEKQVSPWEGLEYLIERGDVDTTNVRGVVVSRMEYCIGTSSICMLGCNKDGIPLEISSHAWNGSYRGVILMTFEKSFYCPFMKVVWK